MSNYERVVNWAFGIAFGMLSIAALCGSIFYAAHHQLFCAGMAAVMSYILISLNLKTTKK